MNSRQQTAIAVYSKPDCPGCFATKRHLGKLDLAFTEVDITEDRGAYDFVIGLGHQAAPVVVLEDGTSWSGYRPDLIKTLTKEIA